MKNTIGFFLLCLLSVQTPDAFAQWVCTNPITSNFYCFAANSSYLYAGGFSGIYYSSDAGNTWTKTVNEPTVGKIYALLSNGSAIYAGTDGGGVALSTNNGANWTDANTGMSSTRVKALASSGSKFFAGAYDAGMYFSANSGLNWSRINQGPINNLTQINCLLVSGTTVFAGTLSGVMATTDDGVSWTARNNGVNTSNDVYAMATDGSKIYTAFDYAVYTSIDNGANWTMMPSAPSGYSIYGLAISGSKIFAATLGAGVFVSTNGGTSWTAINNGLTDLHVKSITINGSNVVIGTSSKGIFKRSLSDLSSIDENIKEESPFVYSNPVRDAISISINNKYVNEEVALSLIDLNGRTIYHAIVKGEDLHKIKTSDLANGIYFLNTGGSFGTVSKKVLIQN